MLGAQWLCSEHADAVRTDLVDQRGRRAAFELEGRRLYTLCVGEKGVNRFRLRARGKAGHGSVPALGDNALLKLAPAIERLREQPPLEPNEAGIAFLEGVLERELGAPRPASSRARSSGLRGLSPLLAAYIAEPMLRVTLVPTMARPR